MTKPRMADFQTMSHVLTGEGESPAGAGGGPRHLEFDVWEAATGLVYHVRIDIDSAVATLVNDDTAAEWGSAVKVKDPPPHLLPGKDLLKKIRNAEK